MAEFVDKRCEDMIPVLEQMGNIKLFDKSEIKNIAKKLKEFEYKIQRHTKCKEDYLRYIQYEMDLLKLIKQRRDHFNGSISLMLSRMLQVHRDKPKCWHIAARWELEENKNKEGALQFLLRGLQIHPDSQLLHIDAFKLELDTISEVSNSGENAENCEDSSASATVDDKEIPSSLKRAYSVYRNALEHIKDIKFIIELLNITKEYSDIEKLQKKIIWDMIQEYAHEALTWDTMARRELQGLIQPSLTDTPMELENSEQTSLRDRITSCNKVYQTAVKKIKTEEMWSLYVDCLLEINRDQELLPNFKKKLLRTALVQGHQAKKLKEKYYLHWINMLISKEISGNDENALNEVLRGATDAIPDSVSLWCERIKHLLQFEQENEADTVLSEATEKLGEKALPLWRMRILHSQIRSSEDAEKIFEAALKHVRIAKEIKPIWLEWLVLTKGIRATRKAYENFCRHPPTSLEVHKKMAMLECLQPEASLEHMRRPHEMATLQFGSDNTSVWLDYIKFEMNYGSKEGKESKKIGNIYMRAVKNLDSNLTKPFMEEHSLFMAKSDNANSK
ncbi:U3 small nucleolar RNA-associated protein 6 homolog [Linepithema humile]|uniref:U3 small nucleolar RNA-associated protein 6 homolog n=1 Tax=Linepithema humile TaxID=83485 RepID=UPI00351E6A38